MANLRLPSNYSSVPAEHLSVTLPRNLTPQGPGAVLLPLPLTASRRRRRLCCGGPAEWLRREL
ncbi:hypothetical protein E2C01_096607 [Portunus trituberculatus]|uniref:Uncharacterized protein n=1 Tax=Portunus trituberculatus TaxID=210409 RepID=A0A5B7K8P8_PORTR|nr:hypothetical protein [Portunus trituberculatus]